MKVLKLKDPTTFTELLIKRGNNLIIPTIDGDGNFIVGLEILIDPVYEDLYEIIIDLSELIEHKPFDINKDVKETTPKIKNGIFKSIYAQELDIEKAIIRYKNKNPIRKKIKL